MVSIENDGPPIAPDILLHLFELFFTTRSQREGKSMGLTIVRRILENIMGKLCWLMGSMKFFTSTLGLSSRWRLIFAVEGSYCKKINPVILIKWLLFDIKIRKLLTSQKLLAPPC